MAEEDLLLRRTRLLAIEQIASHKTKKDRGTDAPRSFSLPRVNLRCPSRDQENAKPGIDIYEHLFYNVIRRKPKLAAFR